MTVRCDAALRISPDAITSFWWEYLLGVLFYSRATFRFSTSVLFLYMKYRPCFFLRRLTQLSVQNRFLEPIRFVYFFMREICNT